MPIRRYEGETYVAFMDLSGFKEMMKRIEQAANSLDHFYDTVYRVARQFTQKDVKQGILPVNAIVVSDSAIIFSRNSPAEHDKIAGLRSILSFIQKVNLKLIVDASLMTTSVIDYGRFKYDDRVEFEGIGKDYFVGQPYIDAYLNNENGKPRIQPGQCRLLKDNLSKNYYYFYWMLSGLGRNFEILHRFKQDYADTYQLKYRGMISVLKKYAEHVTTSQF
jgi:hypothetical protein